uniref:Ig-like domain-containing protein n=1 Tax=Fundulus heteroclitus TaxID=8078 RepID=A0A3Q2QVG6_FUNHE
FSKDPNKRTGKPTNTCENLTVKCPVKLCGKSFNVTWCKFSNTTICEIIPNMKNRSIRQEYHGDNLISYLTFNWVSINDDGLYRCDLGNGHKSVSHTINISHTEFASCSKGIHIKKIILKCFLLAPSSPILRTQFPVVNGIESSSKAERTTSTSPALAHIGNKPAVTNRAAKIQYAVIKVT